MDEHQDRINGYVEKWLSIPEVRDALHKRPPEWSRELVKAIAEDIGKDTIAYIEVMYPDAIKATSSTFKTSIKNHIYNQIMAAIEVNDAGQIGARLKDRADFRKEWLKTYRTLRRKTKHPNGSQHGADE